MVGKLHYVLGFLLLFVAVQADEKKKLKLVLDKLEKVNDAEHIMKTELTFDKDEGDNQVKVNGYVQLEVEMSEDYKLTFDISHCSEQNGEYKQLISTPEKTVCEIMQNQYRNYFYDTFKDHCANAPDPEICPVAADKFEINSYPLDSTKFQKYLRPGFYHIIGTLRHNDEEVLQYRVEAHTENE